MVDPARLGADSDVFVSGNDAEAKATIAGLLREQFGWTRVIDLGDLSTARGTEQYLPLWIRLWGALGTSGLQRARRPQIARRLESRPALQS